jgi:hypothetical protein
LKIGIVISISLVLSYEKIHFLPSLNVDEKRLFEKNQCKIATVVLHYKDQFETLKILPNSAVELCVYSCENNLGKSAENIPKY